MGILPGTVTARTDYTVVAGQSHATDWREYPATGAYMTSLLENSITNYPVISVQATGGSSMLKKFVRADAPTAYWWDEDTSSAGPLLTAAVTAIGALSPTATKLVWLQGHQDAGLMTDAADEAVYLSAMTSVIAALRAAMLPANANGVRVAVGVINRRVTDGDLPGWNYVRDAQLTWLATGVNAKAVHYYDMEFTDDAHMDHNGYRNLGWRCGQAICKNLSISTIEGPEIDTGSLSVTGNVLDIPITVESGEAITKPTNPCGFAFFNGSTEVVPTSWTWSGNTLKATFASSPTGLKMYFPYQNFKDYRYDQTIHYTATDAPAKLLNMTGLPLKAIKSRTI